MTGPQRSASQYEGWDCVSMCDHCEREGGCLGNRGRGGHLRWTRCRLFCSQAPSQRNRPLPHHHLLQCQRCRESVTVSVATGLREGPEGGGRGWGGVSWGAERAEQTHSPGTTQGCDAGARQMRGVAPAALHSSRTASHPLPCRRPYRGSRKNDLHTRLGGHRDGDEELS